MPTPGPVRRGRSSTQIGEGTIRRGRVRGNQSRDADRLAQLEAENAQQEEQLETQGASIVVLNGQVATLQGQVATLQSDVDALEADVAALETSTVRALRPQAVVCHHAGVTRAFVRRPFERWEPLRLATVLVRASLRG